MQFSLIIAYAFNKLVLFDLYISFLFKVNHIHSFNSLHIPLLFSVLPFSYTTRKTESFEKVSGHS